ncbi:MAG: ATP-dependent DNA helicase [Clostridiaceae bacterium]|nr:ATP-dependent DNA helicase [Clostridiaceae bacterium]
MTSIKISVRDLVEFILRSGDLSVSSTGFRDPDAMQEGTRIHKKLQKRMGSGYRAEISLSREFPLTCDGIDFQICLEGRADGIFRDKTGEIIDEIKGVYQNIHSLKEPVPVHRAQALCYACIYALENKLPEIGIRLTYCHIPTEEVRYFPERLTCEALEAWLQELLAKYAKWIAWQLRWQDTRNQQIKKLEFPFSYREGQAKLVKGVYQSILRKKRLYIEAPTGVGKTISTIFPTVKSIGEGLTEKIFYLTAKTITRTVAEDTFLLLQEHGAPLKSVTLTAKEKICILEKPSCNPSGCGRAKGHFDRVNDAVFDILTHETLMNRNTILEYAEKHMVCPFEFSLDIATWCDVITGDYNYAFDPTASLKRFFAAEKQMDYVFLIDEAHNLVSRAREMYSAALVKEDFLLMKKITKQKSKRVTNALDSCNRSLLALKKRCDETERFDSLDIEEFVFRLMRLCTYMEEYFEEDEHAGKDKTPLLPEEKEPLLNFYFEARAFQNIYELTDEHYIIYGDYGETGAFRLHLQCMDPSANLDLYLKKGRCSVFFSATLLPVQYYREQLAGREEDYAVYAPSPFSAEKRLLMIGRDVSTKYTARGPGLYQKIAAYITAFCRGTVGNYMAFFPSYRMLEEVREYLPEEPSIRIFSQTASMTEAEREAFLSHFENSPSHTTIGLCVLGGIFSEGIDLKDSRLIGAVIVGTGLPMVCTENELFKDYFDEKKGTGFSYAYQYPGMNKVLQAAGRVIRTTEDVGAILLLDDRFLQRSYQKLFPREWFPYNIVTQEALPDILHSFWERYNKNRGIDE